MLKVLNLHKKFEDFSLTNVSFSIEAGDYFVLCGPSGAGKTLLMETIAGLHFMDFGQILLEGVDISNTKTQHRNIGLVFQKDAIFPHLTVEQNIAYPLKVRKINKKYRSEIIANLSNRLNIIALLNRKPERLSGGELQRVLIARTMAMNPKLLILDEPLSFLDRPLKAEMIDLLREVNAGGTTILHITHDHQEAFALANKMGVINSGELTQIGTPMELYKNPKSVFVAKFMGIDNIFSANAFEQYVVKHYHAISDHFREKITASSFIIVPQEALSFSIEETPDMVFHEIVTFSVYPDKTIFKLSANIDFYLDVYEVKNKMNSENLMKKGLYLKINFAKLVYLGKNT